MITSYRDALKFMNSLSDFRPVLVYSYHPEKPYSFRSPREFPYCSQTINNTVRHAKHYTMNFDALTKDDIILVTGFVEFQTTATLLNGLDHFDELKWRGYEKDVLYTKPEIQHFFNDFRDMVFSGPMLFPFAKFDDLQKSEVIQRIRRLEKVIESQHQAECQYSGRPGIAVLKDPIALLWQKRYRQKRAILKGLYRVLGIEK